MRRILKIAIEAAHAAGRAIRPLYGRAIPIGDKGAAGPVTEADLTANACIQTILLTAFPQDGWLSEETADRPSRLGKARVWIIDPLDGTKEFISGVPEFVVSVGLAMDGEPVLGVLYNPITEETFAGIRGQGAWLNDSPIHVASTTDIASSRFYVSRTEASQGLLMRFAGGLNLQPLGSVAYKCGHVAAGGSEGLFTQRPRNEWDICAGVALIEAAGGRVTDRTGRRYRFNQPDPLKVPIVGTNGHIHEALLAILNADTAEPR